MRAMVLEKIGRPLAQRERPDPEPGRGEILVRVLACGVCRTDLHLVDGELPETTVPIIPGHEIVGEVAALGSKAQRFRSGERVGIPWLGRACGVCPFCRSGAENLCDAPLFTGYTRDGGYASHAVADERFCFPLPTDRDAQDQAPLLCAGLIGWRALKRAGDGRRLGLYGFGAAAHLILQAALYEGREVFAFVRPGDEATAAFARSLGASWAGASDAPAPALLDAAILFAPVGALVPAALRAVRKGGRVVCAGIHMSDIPAFPYDILWGEREVASVANLTREDGREFLAFAHRAAVRPRTHPYPLAEANRALDDLRHGCFEGAAVLVP